MSKNSIAAAVAVSIGLLGVSNEARALGPVDVEIGAKAGYASNPGSGDPNPLGVGLGGRAGVSFFGVYAGVNVLYYFGGTKDFGGLGSISAHSLLYGVEAGYSFSIVDILTIRPQLGVGNITLSSNGSVGTVMLSGPSSVNNLYLEPGVTGLIGLGMYFVGADANLLILPNISTGNGNSSTETSFTLHGQVGVKF